MHVAPATRQLVFVDLRLFEAPGHFLFQSVQFVLGHELRKWADLLLVKKRDKVVSEPPDFAISCPHQFLLKLAAILLPYRLMSLQLVKVGLTLSARSFPCLLFKDEAQEGAFMLLRFLL